MITSSHGHKIHAETQRNAVIPDAGRLECDAPFDGAGHKFDAPAEIAGYS
jgi:hypothetical protein